MKSSRGGKFYLWISLLTLVVCLIATSVFAFKPGPGLWACLLALGLVAIGTTASYPLLERDLQAGNIRFLQKYFLGMLLRICLLIIGGVVVWKGTGWSLKYYLISTALSYPLFLIFEAWTLSKMLGGDKEVNPTSDGERMDDKESAGCF